MTYTDYAYICKTLGDQIRLRIFDMLKKGKKCAYKILEKFKITQPTLSYHMKMLTQCGIVNSEKDGKLIYYSINQEALKNLVEFLSSQESLLE
ncbi:MAG TPA: metalloregulator ArsR/SmtB family transcription factor [Clostridia bacterium]